MKVLESIKLDVPEVVDGESDESSQAKEKVFKQVKKLFHLTSNKSLVLKKYSGKKKDCDKKIRQCGLIEAKLMKSKDGLEKDITTLNDKLQEAKNLLRQSLEEVA